MTSQLADALLAARLLAHSRDRLGGMCLRGGGPARDLVLDALRALLPPETPFRRLPGHIDDDRLSGGTDIAASLASGTLVLQRGLLAEVAGGVLVIPMAERLRIDIAGRVAQAMDNGAAFLLILLEDGADGDDRPPPALMERVAFDLSLNAVRPADLATPLPAPDTPTPATLDSEAMSALAATATALGVASLRPLLHSATAARAHAALTGRALAEMADLEAATRLILAPRATQLPPEPEQPQPPAPEQPEREQEQNDSEEDDTPPDIPEDLLIEAARAMIPPDVLDAIAKGRAQRSARGGGQGRRTGSAMRGKPLGARPGMPGGGVRMALVDTLRAAIPWQGSLHESEFYVR
ncbi:MAG TPA: hypothetical protein PK823_15830 [Novosphingobium sp.]|nr:hypothetical protein [Novosphingobium sp.]